MAKLRQYLLVGMCAALMSLVSSGCRSAAPTLVIAPPTAAPLNSPSPVAATATITPAPLVPTSAPTAILAPTLLNRYPLAAGMLAESIAVTPGRVWVGSTFGTLEERDASNGALLQTYTLAPPSYDGIAPVKSIVYDGKQLWALFAWKVTAFDQYARLWVFDLSTNQVVAEIDVSDADPARLGTAPGQVWLQGQVFNAETREAAVVEMQLDSTVFAYDGAGIMWAAGAETCETCADNVYRYMVIDPANPLPAPRAQGWVRQILNAHERIWLLTDLNELEGFDQAAQQEPDRPPTVRLHLSDLSEDLPAAIVYDGHYLWLLSSYGADGTWLFRLDAQTGRQLSALQIDRPAEDYTAVNAPVALAFDGRDLWVLTARELLRVGLPWTR